MALPCTKDFVDARRSIVNIANLLLLQIIEAVKKELAVALDILPRWQDLASDCPNPMLVEHVRKIAGLRVSMAALEGALTHPDSGIIH